MLPNFRMLKSRKAVLMLTLVLLITQLKLTTWIGCSVVLENTMINFQLMTENQLKNSLCSNHWVIFSPFIHSFILSWSPLSLTRFLLCCTNIWNVVLIQRTHNIWNMFSHSIKRINILLANEFALRNNQEVLPRIYSSVTYEESYKFYTTLTILYTL